MACAICEIRRPRRFCPGVGGDICSTCCGTERENTVDCPLDCEYLQQARRHEKPAPLDPEAVPNRDYRLTEEFLEANEALVTFLAGRLVEAALGIPGAVDSDVREALDALIRTHRTLQSGIYYESLPDNPLAAGIFRRVQEAAQQFREGEKQETGISRTRDGDVLGALIFLQRLEMDRNNGRRRGRAFLDTLRRNQAGGAEPDSAPATGSSLILP
jgi:hypothetical protein